VDGGWAGLTLTDLLHAVGAFSGRAPAPPAAGRPQVPDDVVAALADVPEPARRGVLDPLGRAGGPGTVGHRVPLHLPSLMGRTVRAQQVDASTCGSAVLAMVALAGDARLALRLARAADPASAFAALQHSVKRATNRTAGGIPAWPGNLGTPPWGAARVARYGPVRFTHRVVSHRRSGGDGAWDAVLESVRAGVPVPLFTGGDLRQGWRTAVPRHVVLLAAVTRGGAGRREDVARVYEPSSGTLHAVPFGVLGEVDANDAPGRETEVVRAARLAALGGWPHVTWALLPSGRS
jgi:hypothetical protein